MPRASSSARAPAASPKPRRSPSLAGEHVEHPQVRQRAGVAQRRAERARPALPVEERSRLLHDGATGNTTSARSVTSLRRSSRLTTNPAPVQRVERRVGIGQVGGVDAADQQRGGGPGRRRGSRRCRGRGRRAGRPRPTPWRSRRACRVGDGRPPGSSVGSAPASIAPRSPARRGTHASRAPVSSASRAAAQSAPGTPRAVRRPGSPRPVRQRLVAASSASSARGASPPGTVGSSAARHPFSPRLA